MRQAEAVGPERGKTEGHLAPSSTLESERDHDVFQNRLGPSGVTLPDFIRLV